MCSATGLAGCTEILNTIADYALEDVNIFNELSRPLSGSIEIKAEDGTTVLSKSFDLVAKTPEEPTEGATRAYPDVWTGSGTYTVRVELADGMEVRGQSSTDTSVTINDPDKQMLAVAFGAPNTSAGIYLTVADEFTDIQP